MKCIITNYITSITMGERLEHQHSKVWDKYDFFEEMHTFIKLTESDSKDFSSYTKDLYFK